MGCDKKQREEQSTMRIQRKREFLQNNKTRKKFQVQDVTQELVFEECESENMDGIE